MAKEMTLENLAEQMAEGFATQGTEIKKQGKRVDDLTESVALIVKHMATKEETATKSDIVRLEGHFVKVGTQLVSMEDELKTINRRISALEDAVGNLAGFVKEVVELRNRLETIERHLGLDKKVPA
ncbi:MAG: hypothetical protein Q7S26_02330 [bacterium]|nr:hypothetical protein [bacterium]